MKNSGYLIPTPIEGYDTVCLKLEIPDHPLYRAAIVGAITTLSKWWSWEKTGDNSGSIAAQMWRNLIISTLEIGDCGGEFVPVFTNGDEFENLIGGCEFELENLIELLEQLDMKFTLNGEVYEPAIPLIPACGCGTENNESDYGVPVPGSIPGGIDYSNITTLCDFITTTIPFIRNQVDVFLDTIGNGSFFVDFASDLTPWASVADQLLESLEDVERELDENEFLDAMKIAALRSAFPDPIVEVNRQQLRSFARKIPNNFDGAPMGLAFLLWAEFANVESINIQIPKAARTGSQSDCETLFAQVGREQYNPTENTGNAQITVLDTVFPDFKVYKLNLNTEILDRDFFVKFRAPQNETFRGFVWLDSYRTVQPNGFAEVMISIKMPTEDDYKPYLGHGDREIGNWVQYYDGTPNVLTVLNNLYTSEGGTANQQTRSEGILRLQTGDIDGIALRSNSYYVNIGSRPEMYLTTLYIISQTN